MSGEIQGLRHFYLYLADECVVQYNGRLSQHQEQRRFVKVARGYTRELIVGYWKAAKEYLRLQHENRPSQVRKTGIAWTVAHQGSDLRDIEEGKTQV